MTSNFFISVQLTPFPYDMVKAELLKYPNARVVWVQEEHKNMGPYQYVEPRLRTTFKKIGQDKKVESVLVFHLQDFTLRLLQESACYRPRAQCTVSNHHLL
jgi:hypothetical protein